MPNLGQWLVTLDELQESDMIVVLTGSVPDRILQVLDIYNERYSDKIVLVNSYRVDCNIFVERGVEIPPGNAQLSKMAAIDLGVPEENILILEGNAKNTQDEAKALKKGGDKFQYFFVFLTMEKSLAFTMEFCLTLKI